jgi:hypothetical protein
LSAILKRNKIKKASPTKIILILRVLEEKNEEFSSLTRFVKVLVKLLVCN